MESDIPLITIPPRNHPRRNTEQRQPVDSSSLPGSSENPPIRGRQTRNSRRAVLDPITAESPRTRSQEVVASRVNERISASRTRTALRTSQEVPTRTDSDSIVLNNKMTGPAPGAQTSTSGGTAHQYTMPSRRMPKPNEKNAPSFDAEKPEELGRFFDLVEDWFEEEGVTSDAEKKKRIIKYLDADTEIQWKAFHPFEEGTYIEFKAHAMAAYPKAEEVMKGSMTALKRKVISHGAIDIEDRDTLHKLIRVITAEVAKLKKITPPIHMNRELVDLFLSRLSPSFAARVAQKLSMHRLYSGLVPGQEANANRNPEDMYDINEVMKMANHASLENANPFGKFLWSTTESGSETNVKLEEAVARLTDSINLQTQYNRQVDKRLANLQSFMAQPRTENFAASSGYNRGLAPAQNQFAAAPRPDCFYCRGDHRITNCEHALRHLDLNWLLKSEGRLKLPDGSNIPRDGNKSMKEVVESLNKTKPGIIPMSKIQDKASLYQDNSHMGSYLHSHMDAIEEGNMRHLLDVIQRMGPDRVQSILNAQTQTIEEDDEWSQNFD